MALVLVLLGVSQGFFNSAERPYDDELISAVELPELGAEALRF